jgi:hypothetical protein
VILVATKLALLVGRRGPTLAIFSVVTALLGAKTTGFWDGPH